MNKLYLSALGIQFRGQEHPPTGSISARSSQGDILTADLVGWNALVRVEGDHFPLVTYPLVPTSELHKLCTQVEGIFRTHLWPV